MHNWQLKTSGTSLSTWIIQEHCYLIVMISPGFAWMYQLQLTRAGYSEGHPGLVIVPLGDRICSGISPQAKKYMYLKVINWLIPVFLKANRTKPPHPINQHLIRENISELDDIPIKKPTILKEFVMEHVSQKMYSNTASAAVFSYVSYYYRLNQNILCGLWWLYLVKDFLFLNFIFSLYKDSIHFNHALTPYTDKCIRRWKTN